MSLRIVADVKRVWRPLVDLLASNTPLPHVRFDWDAVRARNFSQDKTTLYDLFCPRAVFGEYSVSETVYAELDGDWARRELRKMKGEVVLEAREGRLYLDGVDVGRVIPPEEFEWAPELKLTYLNDVTFDAYRFKEYLRLSRRVGAHYLGFDWVSEPVVERGLRIAAFDENVWVEYGEPLGTRIRSTCMNVYIIDTILQFLPPTAVVRGVPQTVRIHDTGESDHPVHGVAAGFEPAGVDFRFWIAPFIEGSETLRKLLEKPRPEVVASAVIDPDRAEMLFDLLQSNLDDPELLFSYRGLQARNMDPSHTSFYQLTVEPGFFADYMLEKEVYGRIMAVKDVVKSLVRIAKLMDRNVRLTVEDNRLVLEGCVVGLAEPEKEEFEAGELKLQLRNRLSVDGRGFRRLHRSMRKRGADYVAFAFDPEWPPDRPARIIFFDDELFEEYETTDTAAERSISAFDMDLVEQFLPPSVFRKAGLAVRIWCGTFTPCMMQYSPFFGMDFTACVAPHEATWRLARKLGWLKPLTEEDVLEVVRERAPEPVGLYEIRDTLLKRMVDVAMLGDVIGRLVDAGRLVREEKGYTYFYYLPEQPPVLKPLTEQAILEAIRRLCEAWDTDAVGYRELETVLGREYDIGPLHDMLRSLAEKGLVESKPWPSRRPGGYVVDMRGYWSLKPTEPEEAVKQAEEVVEFKPLTEEAVLEELRRLHQEVKLNVYVDGLRERLLDKGYDTTELPRLLSELKARDIILLWPDGRVWLKEYVEKKPPPKPPIPKGYARVHFKRDMVRFMGTEKPPRMYGPYKACEEAVIPKIFADAFERAGYVEILGRGSDPDRWGYKRSEEKPAVELVWEEEGYKVALPEPITVPREWVT